MSPADLVAALWTRIQDRDWDGARATLADDYVSDGPATGELIGPADNFIAMNRAYPPGWEIFVDEVIPDGDRVVSRVRVTLGDNTFHCVSFFDVEGDKIVRSVDFWVTDRGETPPDWRAPYWVPKESS